MLWKILVSVTVGIVVSPFVGTLASNIYIPYAKSDSEISAVFEVSTVVAFPILAVVAFILLRRLFHEGRDR
jgi:uncharacterized protein HemY